MPLPEKGANSLEGRSYTSCHCRSESVCILVLQLLVILSVLFLFNTWIGLLCPSAGNLKTTHSARLRDYLGCPICTDTSTAISVRHTLIKPHIRQYPPSDATSRGLERHPSNIKEIYNVFLCYLQPMVAPGSSSSCATI